MELNNSDAQFKRTVRRKTIRAFSFFILFVVLAIAGWNWLMHQPEDNGALYPLRKVLKTNGKVFSSLYSNNHLAPEYPKTAAVKNVRVNGDVGMGEGYDTTGWKLQVIRYSPKSPMPSDTFYVTLDELKKNAEDRSDFQFQMHRRMEPGNLVGWSAVF
jgi:hypothetical protein